MNQWFLTVYICILILGTAGERQSIRKEFWIDDLKLYSVLLYDVSPEPLLVTETIIAVERKH